MNTLSVFVCVFVQYQLETFTEGRKTTWQHEPFAGSYSDQSISPYSLRESAFKINTYLLGQNIQSLALGTKLLYVLAYARFTYLVKGM